MIKLRTFTAHRRFVGRDVSIRVGLPAARLVVLAPLPSFWTRTLSLANFERFVLDMESIADSIPHDPQKTDGSVGIRRKDERGQERSLREGHVM